MSYPKFLLNGDTTLAVEYGNEISEDINAKVLALFHLLEEKNIPGIIEAIPTYRSLLIHYDPELLLYDDLVAKLSLLVDRDANEQTHTPIVLEIPVLYGGEEGPDLDYVASYHNKTREEIIKMHCAQEYLIYMLGFTPGFAYLGGMNPELSTPRLKTPRVKIPAGSVGIAGSQTGIYPIDSPGGWQLIGRTPVRMYDGERENPILPEAGMYIQFYPIDRAEYERILKAEEEGTYVCRRHTKEEAAK